MDREGAGAGRGDYHKGEGRGDGGETTIKEREGGRWGDYHKGEGRGAATGRLT